VLRDSRGSPSNILCAAQGDTDLVRDQSEVAEVCGRHRATAHKRTSAARERDGWDGELAVERYRDATCKRSKHTVLAGLGVPTGTAAKHLDGMYTRHTV